MYPANEIGVAKIAQIMFIAAWIGYGELHRVHRPNARSAAQ
jgi:hypothetical protein